MTIRDILEQFEIQGALRVQTIDAEDKVTVFYDTQDHESQLVNQDYEYLDKEIKYMYPSTDDNDGKEIPQIVIEI